MSDDVVEIDLDAMRAARLETKGGHRLRQNGEVFELRPEFLYSWRALYDAGDAVAVTKAVLAAEDWERFLGTEPSDDDFRAFASAVPPLYGLSLGESLASNGSSRSTGPRSRRTLTATTKSTSAKRSGAKSRSGSGASSG